MGSNYFGETNLGNERYGGGGGGSSSSSSSSRKGKKKKSAEKQPKQPQRGLGVAQLEKLRLDSQMAVAAAYNINSDSLNPSYPTFLPNPQEDIRVERPYISSSSSPSSFNTSTLPSLTSYGFDAPQTIKMLGKGEPERVYVSSGDSQPSLNTRWNAGKTVPGIQHSQQSQLITRKLIGLEAEETTGKNYKKARCDSVGSGSAVSGSSNSEELDLELRLSL